MPLRGGAAGEGDRIGEGHGDVHRVEPRGAYRAEDIDPAQGDHLDRGVAEVLLVRLREASLEGTDRLIRDPLGAEEGEDGHTLLVHEELSGEIGFPPDGEADQISGAQDLVPGGGLLRTLHLLLTGGAILCGETDRGGEEQGDG